MGEHYYTTQPRSRERPVLFYTRILSSDFRFEASSGVFSKDHVDDGTLTLIESTKPRPEMEILDLGCGYGPVGIVLGRLYKCSVTMSDINERALRLATKNAVHNETRVRIIQSDGYQKIPELFDMILLNPPQSAGRRVCEGLISGGLDHLKQGGSFYLVARARKGGKTLSEIMKKTYGNVKVVGRKRGFTVWCSMACH